MPPQGSPQHLQLWNHLVLHAATGDVTKQASSCGQKVLVLLSPLPQVWKPSLTATLPDLQPSALLKQRSPLPLGCDHF